MTRAQGVRRTGAAALDLAYVAVGRTDGFWEFGLKAWDVAAGALIIQEARGRVSNLDGSDLDLNGANIVASNSRIHDELIEVLAGARPEAERREARDAPRDQSLGLETSRIFRSDGRLVRRALLR